MPGSEGCGESGGRGGKGALSSYPPKTHVNAARYREWLLIMMVVAQFLLL